MGYIIFAHIILEHIILEHIKFKYIIFEDIIFDHIIFELIIFEHTAVLVKKLWGKKDWEEPKEEINHEKSDLTNCWPKKN